MELDLNLRVRIHDLEEALAKVVRSQCPQCLVPLSLLLPA